MKLNWDYLFDKNWRILLNSQFHMRRTQQKLQRPTNDKTVTIPNQNGRNQLFETGQCVLLKAYSVISSGQRSFIFEIWLFVASVSSLPQINHYYSKGKRLKLFHNEMTAFFTLIIVHNNFIQNSSLWNDTIHIFMHNLQTQTCKSTESLDLNFFRLNLQIHVIKRSC